MQDYIAGHLSEKITLCDLSYTAGYSPFYCARIFKELTGLAPADYELHPVKRTVKKYKVFPVSSHVLLAAFYAARLSLYFSIGVNTPRLRCTRLVL